MDNCWFSVFDRVDAQRFKDADISHILYQPLAVDEDQIREWDRQAEALREYKDEICFVGRLYDDNFYDEFLQSSSTKIYRTILLICLKMLPFAGMELTVFMEQ